MKVIYASLISFGLCFSLGPDLKTGEYFSALNEEKAPIFLEAKAVNNHNLVFDHEPEIPHTSLASSLISQIQIWGNMPVKF